MKKLALALALVFITPLANADQLVISSGGFMQTFNGAFASLDMTNHSLVMNWTTTSTVSGQLPWLIKKQPWTVELIGGGEDSTQYFTCKGDLTIVGFSRNLTLICYP